jgi:hypothetical protein
VAAEESGDVLGGALMDALRACGPMSPFAASAGAHGSERLASPFDPRISRSSDRRIVPEAAAHPAAHPRDRRRRDRGASRTR